MRRTTQITIEAEGRDQGKKFQIEELPAQQAEEWFIRAMQLLARSGVEVPPEIFARGGLGFAAMGLGSILTGVGKIPWQDVKPLMDEMWRCVRYISPNGTLQSDHSLVDTQIEEVGTRLKLREEVLSLHLGFSLLAKLSELRTTALAMISTINEIGGIIPTSPVASEPSSRPN